MIRALLGDGVEMELHFYNERGGATGITLTRAQWEARPSEDSLALVWPGDPPRFFGWATSERCEALEIALAACRKMEEMRSLGAP